ncbi:unnamed protein product, partial [Prorocentrum cordatum]
SVQPRAARRPSDEGGLLLCGRRRSQSSGGEGSKQEGRGGGGLGEGGGCDGRGAREAAEAEGYRRPGPAHRDCSAAGRLGPARARAGQSGGMFPLHCSSSTTLLHSKDRTTRPRKAPTDLLPSAPSGGGPPRARRAPRAPSER